MSDLSRAAGRWLGLCRKPPVIAIAPAYLLAQPKEACVSRQGGVGSPGSSRRIRDGIGIATGSIRALFRDRHLLWFGYFTGLVLLFLLLAEAWKATHIGDASPFLVSAALGGTFWVLDLRTFFLEMICLTGLTLVLAGLVLHRHALVAGAPVPITESFSRINGHANALIALSIGMAVIATLAYLVVSETLFFGRIVSAVDMAVFFLPYAYYFPDPLISAVYFAATLMAINSLVFLVAFAVVPEIVLSQKRLLPAVAGASARVLANRRAILGCLLVAGGVLLAIAAVALLIGQSPLLLGRDYDFFLQVSRGQILMTAVCYGFMAGCWVLLALGYTAAGIAAADLSGEEPAPDA